MTDIHPKPRQRERLRPRADVGNAHVRKRTTTRQSPDVQAEDARRLLDDPAFQRAFDAVKEGMVNEIINFKHDGSESSDNYERECCRTLRTLNGLRRALVLGVQGQQLRLADFQSHTQKPET